MTQGEPHGSEAVLRYHDGELAPEERRAFEAHLSACEECRKTLRAAEAALGALDDSLAPPLELDEALAAIRRGEANGRRRRLRRRLAWVGLGLAAAAALLALALGGRPGVSKAPEQQQEYAPRKSPGPLP